MGHLNPDEDEEVPNVPCYWVWDWFWELSSGRSYHQGGPEPIYKDIEYWSRMTGNILLREEIDMLRLMDNAFRSALSEERQNHREREKAERDAR
jgi:hypothetical protein